MVDNTISRATPDKPVYSEMMSRGNDFESTGDDEMEALAERSDIDSKERGFLIGMADRRDRYKIEQQKLVVSMLLKRECSLR